MRTKKFTVIMLLLIVVIGLLVIFVLPTVLQKINDNKKENFLLEAKSVYTKAGDKFTYGKNKGQRIKYITNIKGQEENLLGLDNENDIEYEIRLDNKGKITAFKLTDGNLCIMGTGDFLDSFTTADILEKDEQTDSKDFCVIVSFDEGENLTINLNNNSSVDIKQKPDKITIKYDVGMFYGERELSKDTSGESYIIDTKPYRQNYYFQGYYGENSNKETTEVVSCDRTIQIDNFGLPLFLDNSVTNMNAISKFEKKYYEIQFIGGNGSMSNYKCYYGDTCTLPATQLTNPGYQFVGWSSAENGSLLFKDEQEIEILDDNNDDLYIGGYFKFDESKICQELTKKNQPSSNIKKLYALWKPIEYEVQYDCNGGSGSMVSTKHVYGTYSNLRKNACTKKGSDFLGWSKTAKATSATYTNEQNVTDLSQTGGVVKLYAIWTAHIANITLDNRDAVTSGTAKIYLKTNQAWYLNNEGTQKITKIPVLPKRPDYTFTGYYDGKERIIDKDGNIKAATNKYSDDKTLNAKWCRNCLTLTNGSCQIIINDDGTCKYNTTCNPGYAISNNGQYNVVCTAKSYNIEFNANGGSNAPATQVKNENVSVNISTTQPVRNGYTFTGWNTKVDGTGTNYSPGSTYTANSNVTLHAQWKNNVYTITLNNNGASVAGTTVIYLKYGAGWYSDQSCTNKITNISVPSKNANAFLGYYDSSSNSYISSAGKITASNTITLESKTLTAKWVSSCPTGQYPSGGTCVPCPAGTYKNSIGNASCTSCPEGYNSPEGSKAKADCVITCQANYRVASVDAQCTSCGTGYNLSTHTVQAGSTSSECNPNKFYLVYYANTTVSSGSTSIFQQCSYNSDCIVMSNMFHPSNTSLTFKGWNRGSVSGPSVTPGINLKNFTSANGAQIPMYANWGNSTVNCRMKASCSGYTAGNTCYRIVGAAQVIYNNDGTIKTYYCSNGTRCPQNTSMCCIPSAICTTGTYSGGYCIMTGVSGCPSGWTQY